MPRRGARWLAVVWLVVLLMAPMATSGCITTLVVGALMKAHGDDGPADTYGSGAGAEAGQQPVDGGDDPAGPQAPPADAQPERLD